MMYKDGRFTIPIALSAPAAEHESTIRESLESVAGAHGASDLELESLHNKPVDGLMHYSFSGQIRSVFEFDQLVAQLREQADETARNHTAQEV